MANSRLRADDARIAAETPMPQTMRNDNDTIAAGLAVAGVERATCSRVDTPQLERIGSQTHALKPFCFSGTRHIRAEQRKRAEIRNRSGLLPHIEKVRDREEGSIPI